MKKLGFFKLSPKRENVHRLKDVWRAKIRRFTLELCRGSPFRVGSRRRTARTLAHKTKAGLRLCKIGWYSDISPRVGMVFRRGVL